MLEFSDLEFIQRIGEGLVLIGHNFKNCINFSPIL